MFKTVLLSAILMATHGPLAHAQGSILGNLADPSDLDRGHMRWPAPETVADDLRSANDETRIKALKLMGFTDEQVHRPVWSQSTPSQVMGTRVLTPDETLLIYAALGESKTQEAILAVFAQDLQAAQLAVAVPVAEGWERIAVVGCWCKYEMLNGIDTLSSFFGLQPAPGFSPDDLPERFELVVRTSGGGTGLYNQSEAHFRIHGGQLRNVLSFTSRRRMCDPTSPPPECTLERRWFYPARLGGEPGGILVRAFGRFPEGGRPPVWWSVRDLEIEALHPPRCASFLWDEKSFLYKQDRTKQDPCVAASP
jgi:hypothetical protein